MMARAALVGLSSGAIQEMTSQGCWHVQRRLQESVKRFIHLFFVVSYAEFLPWFSIVI